MEALSTGHLWHYLPGMDSLDHIDAATALAMLEWQVAAGVSEAVGTDPIDRYALEAKPVKPAMATLNAPAAAPEIDAVAVAKAAATGAHDLAALQTALGAYPHCELKNGARSLVFADGQPSARVMIIGEAPGRDEDLAGLPFVGQAGQLLNKMLAAIGMARDHADTSQAVYITNVLPWRPPQNRDPKPEEVAMMMPFLTRHIELADPEVIILMGNHACRAALGQSGITKLRGTWAKSFDRPTLPMFHPAYLLRNPHAKREAWADLLSLQDKLNT